MPANGDS